MSEDPRKQFVLATISNHFGYSVSEGAVAHIPSSLELNTFLDDGNCTMIAARPELIQDVMLIQVHVVWVWPIYCIYKYMYRYM